LLLLCLPLLGLNALLSSANAAVPKSEALQLIDVRIVHHLIAGEHTE
jgi:hypothetical protein